MTLDCHIWLLCIKPRLCRGDHVYQLWGLKPCALLCVFVCVHCTNSTCGYKCGGAMLRVSGVAPAPSGHEWRFQCSVGVDCSDAEPRCIWLAVLKGISPHASPRPTPIASPRKRGSRRVIQRHRLSWVRGKTVFMKLSVPDFFLAIIQYHYICIIFWPWFSNLLKKLSCQD